MSKPQTPMRTRLPQRNMSNHSRRCNQVRSVSRPTPGRACVAHTRRVLKLRQLGQRRNCATKIDTRSSITVPDPSALEADVGESVRIQVTGGDHCGVRYAEVAAFTAHDLPPLPIF